MVVSIQTGAMDSPLVNMVLTCKASDSLEENVLHVYSV
jgi:hypothetical protein